MNKKIILIIFMITGMQIYADETVKENLYVGETVTRMIRLLGKPTEDTLKVIKEDNIIGYEHEPVFSDYFTSNELRETVTVRVVVWKKKNKTIVVWSKKKINDWSIFSSLEWNHSTYF